jgi:acetate kinase
LDYLGIQLDLEKNAGRIKELKAIEHKNSKVKILVIPTNEELEIAQQTYELVR